MKTWQKAGLGVGLTSLAIFGSCMACLWVGEKVMEEGPVPEARPAPAPPPAPEAPPAPPSPAPEATPPEPLVFELKNWEIVDDDGIATLQISFSATKSLEFILTDPAGVEVAFDYAELGVTGARLSMAGYSETPSAGEYTLLVKRIFGEFVDSITFDFEGASLEVIDVETSWEYWEWGDYYTLDGLTMVIVNHGDLAAYIDEVELGLDGEADTLYIWDGAVLPGKEATFTSSVYISDIELGKYELTLKLKDSVGETLATYSTIVKPHD